MKIRFFLLGTDKYASSERLEGELKYVFSDFLTDDGDVQVFSDIKDATNDIAKAVSDTHALVFISDCEAFGNTKLMLSKAFGFELSCDADILSKACETYGKDTSEEDYDFSVCHAFVPQNARTFVLEDGKYAGFSVANGNQTIILLPFEKDRTNALISSLVIPYLNSVYHVNIDSGKYKEYNASRLGEIILAKDLRIAVAGTNTATFFKEYISSAEGLSDRITVSPMTEKRGAMQPVDYVVNLAITASELLSCRYGVAISNAFYTGDSPESEKIVYLAVANEIETAVRELHSFKGEEIPSFLARCSADLCLFICDIIAGDEEHSDDISKREKAAAGRYKTAIAAVAAIIVALAVFSGVYFHTHEYTLNEWADHFIEWIFPAGNPFEGIFTDKTPGSGEDTSSEEQAEASFDGNSEAISEGLLSEEASSEEVLTDEILSDENLSSENTSSDETQSL